MKVVRLRYEDFGGIISTSDPHGLFWVDREYLVERGFDGGPVWSGPERKSLRAPVEMEIAVTSRCNLQCEGCYTGAGPLGRHVPRHLVEEALEVAGAMEVFHVAFGGGEPLLRPDIVDLARLAREKSLMPATTTNGTLVTKTWAREASEAFCRINVSVDMEGGLRERRLDEAPWRAVSTLREAGATVGVNFVLTRENWEHLPTVFRKSSDAGAESVLILRPKPSGRGKNVYDRVRPTAGQYKNLLPALLAFQEEYSLPFHLDCALSPLLLGDPSVSQDSLELLGAYGCIAGDLLVTVDTQGSVRPCSHLEVSGGRVRDLPYYWETHQALKQFRVRAEGLAEPCRSCRSRELCRGGCPVVNGFCKLPLTIKDPDIYCQEHGGAPDKQACHP